MADILAQLKVPFDEEVIEWRPGSTNKDKTQALALAYAPARVYMERLDEVMGTGWQDNYREAPDGGVLCGISLKIDDEWLTRWDGAENTNIESVKGGLSDSFKRACVKWGIGRYLYAIPAQWVACEKKGNTVVFKQKPSITGAKKPPKVTPKQERPYSAVLTKAKILELSGKHQLKKKKLSDAQDKAFIITYASVFPDDNSRYAVTEFVFGLGSTSTKHLEAHEKLALIDWMAWEEVEGKYLASQHAVSEAQIMLRHCEAELGQKELL